MTTSAFASYPSLKGMPVVISGGASGIGESLVREFAAQGAKVGFVDIAAEAGEKLAAELNGGGGTVKFTRCDITDVVTYQGVIRDFEKAHGPALALVNNAANDQRHKWDEVTRLPFWSRVNSAARGLGLTLTYILLGNLLASKEKPWGFKTLALKRHRLRVLANRLGVRQRSLYFALVTHGLNGDGPDKYFSKRVVGAAYTMLDTKRNASDDDFFRVRALEAKFTWQEDFVKYVRLVDDTVDQIEKKDLTKFQIMALTMFATLRSLKRVFPFLPGKRFWRFNNFMDIVLTLVPPHRTYGPMTHGMVEPIYCGAYHPAANICTFCPGREYVTLNFSMEQRHIDNVDKIERLLERVEAMDLDPSGRTVRDEE